MGTLLSFIIGLGSLLVGKKISEKSSEGLKNVNYTVEFWDGTIAKLAGDIPKVYVKKWIEVESNGNPCATGGALNKQGFTLESGLFQLYYPDDFDRQYPGISHITLKSLRAPCDGGNKSKSQVCKRELTTQEINDQISIGIAYINYCRKMISQYTKGKWSGSDYWKMVKMWHALPSLIPLGFGGIFPNNWNEFSSKIETLAAKGIPSYTDKNGVVHYYEKAAISRILENARKTGASVAS